MNIFCKLCELLKLKKCEQNVVDDLIIQDEIAEIINSQFRDYVKKINAELTKTLRTSGSARAEITIHNKDMKDKVAEFYKIQGYDVYKDQWSGLTIKLSKWSEEKK